MSRVTLELSRPINLAAFDQEQPAGAYVVDVDEQAIEGLTFLGTRRVGATVFSPPVAITPTAAMPRQSR